MNHSCPATDARIPLRPWKSLLGALLLGFFAMRAEAGSNTAGATPNRPGRGSVTSEPTRTAADFSETPSEQEFLSNSILPEALVPVGGIPSVTDNRNLADALRLYERRQSPDDVSALTDFLAENKHSSWRVAVLVNLGIIQYHAGRFSETFPLWEEAWRIGKGATAGSAKALVDRALAELARMNARVGRIDRLEALFSEMGTRPIMGSASEILAGARQGLWLMKNEPWKAFRCGPMALDRILASDNPDYAIHDSIYNSRSTTNGFSLQQVFVLSQKLGMKMQPAKRSPGAALLLPAVVNWKVGHFAALIKEQDSSVLVKDPTFGGDLWVSRTALDAEASGYFLVPAGVLPSGWASVHENEALAVFGKGQTSGNNSNGTSPGDGSVGGGPPGCSGGSAGAGVGAAGGSPGESGGVGGVGGGSAMEPMAVYNAKAMVVSLHIQDTPVGYAPPRGPAVRFTITYNHREANQPGNFSYSNFGPKWTFDWLSYLIDDPSNSNSEVSVFLPGGGTDVFSDYNPTNKTYAPELRSRSVLTLESPSSYSLRFPDGSRHVFARPVGAAKPRKVCLTRVIDSRGNSAELIYDSKNRLTSVRDSLGQSSTLSYAASDPLKVTRITDPFGRFASFAYDALGRLTNITDAIGISSGFAYQGATDFIEKLTTPYGTSTFSFGELGTTRWLEMTDPEGGTERVEYRDQPPGAGFEDPVGAPRGMQAFNRYLNFRNTYFWDKKAYHEARGDYSRARVMHWLHDANPSITGRILESEKAPLESRVWYNYPRQTWAGGINAGMIGRPSKVGRILDDGAPQVREFAYNTLGNVTKVVDPLGRTTVYRYDTNLVDLLEIRQTAGVDDLLQSRTYNSQHLPLTVADGSGHTNVYTYNSSGQILTATNPRHETTTHNYATNGYLQSIDGPLPGTNDTTSFTYDGYGRLRTRTDSEGYTLTYEYDALDRRTRTTYPDATFEENTYSRLDRVASRDRNGRITQYGYDTLRHLTSVEDPLHRITSYAWCSCGQIDGLIDPLGRTTKWHRDIQGRVTSKEYVDGSQERYTYEASTSRLKTVTDEKGQVKVYDYLPDDNVWRVSCLNAENITPTVTFTYDAPYNRVKTMTDGIGLTTYGYYLASTNGGQLAFVDGPLTKDTITYDYDELGRPKVRAINGAAQTWDYDSLSRVIVVANALGAFTNSFVGATFRPSAMQYPTGQRTDYAYYDNLADHRLREIHHRLPGNQTLLRFEYAYDPAGQITNWVQQAGAEMPENWSLGYDGARGLISAIVTTNNYPSRSYRYGYDIVGNRLFEEVNGFRRSSSYNPLNELQSADDSGIPSKSYRWDAENRLVGILGVTNRFEILYDGVGRFVQVKEVTIHDVTNVTRFVWCDNELCEARDATGSIVISQFFHQGERHAAQNLYYAGDHLRSVRGATAQDGTPIWQCLYTPFGSWVHSGKSTEIAAGFTGHYRLGESGLHLTRFRAYDSSTARWLSRDPLTDLGKIAIERSGWLDTKQWQKITQLPAELVVGANLFSYLQNDPINGRDLLGLDAARARDCELDQEFCQAASVLVCTAVGVACPNPLVGPVCVIVTQRLCNKVKRDCDKDNRDNGHANGY